MVNNSKIEWTDDTFNPWWGCVKASTACDHCYAERFAGRQTRTKDQLWGKDAPRRMQSDHYWHDPLRWNRRAEQQGVHQQVFCGSMCDVMERRPDLDAPRQQLYQLIEETPNLDWLLLTKRPQEFAKLLPKQWRANPRPNVWLMTTVESAEYLWRIEALLETPAVVHGVSMEPLLGPIRLPRNLLKLGKRAWVITGGESGPGARPSRIEWVRGLRDTCVAAGVPFHFKQWGEHGADGKKVGKKRAGRLLDGREWNELPDTT